MLLRKGSLRVSFALLLGSVFASRQNWSRSSGHLELQETPNSPSLRTIMVLHFRLAEHSDASQIQAIYSPYVLDNYTSFEEEVPSVEEMNSRFSVT